jgi:hypothetical protein
MKKTTSDEKRGITSSTFSRLKYLNVADDIDLVSSRHEYMQEKTRLSHFAKQVGLQLNTKKTEGMVFNTHTQTKLLVDGHGIQLVDIFVYHGTITNTEDSTQKDIKNELSKARTAFYKLQHIWGSKHYSRKTMQQ